MKTPQVGILRRSIDVRGVPVGGDVYGSWSGSPQILGKTAANLITCPATGQMREMGIRLASPFEMSMLTFPVWVEGFLPLGHGPVLRRKEGEK